MRERAGHLLFAPRLSSQHGLAGMSLSKQEGPLSKSPRVCLQVVGDSETFQFQETVLLFQEIFTYAT